MSDRTNAPPKYCYLVWVPPGDYGGGFWDYAGTRADIQDIIDTWEIHGKPVVERYVREVKP